MNTRAKTILFVDDEPYYSRPLVEELEDAGYQVFPISTNASDALQVLESGTHIDLIVLDIMMPAGERITDPMGGRRTGVKLCERIRQDLGLKIPIIFLTVIENQLVHDHLKEIERDAGQRPTVLVKPVSPLKLLAEVRDLIGDPLQGGGLK